MIYFIIDRRTVKRIFKRLLFHFLHLCFHIWRRVICIYICKYIYNLFPTYMTCISCTRNHSGKCEECTISCGFLGCTAWYVCMCMYVYIWYMYIYVCPDDCNKLSSIIISYYFCEKEVTENPSVNREDDHGDCSVSLAAVLLAITKMACCRRFRIVTVIDIICHCCCFFLFVFSPSQKQWTYQ